MMFYYKHDKAPFVYKYLNHGTILETIWTILPALVLIAIAFPSFRLLYLMDSNIFAILETNFYLS